MKNFQTQKHYLSDYDDFIYGNQIAIQEYYPYFYSRVISNETVYKISPQSSFTLKHYNILNEIKRTLPQFKKRYRSAKNTQADLDRANYNKKLHNIKNNINHIHSDEFIIFDGIKYSKPLKSHTTLGVK